jgi:hypothetical protein
LYEELILRIRVSGVFDFFQKQDILDLRVRVVAQQVLLTRSVVWSCEFAVGPPRRLVIVIVSFQAHSLVHGAFELKVLALLV